MTVDEAARIEDQLAQGRIDTKLPGTMELINQAHRTLVDAYMWGESHGLPHRRRQAVLLAVCCAAVAVTILGMTFMFLTSH